MYAMLTILEEKNYKLATFIVLQLDLNMIVLIWISPIQIWIQELLTGSALNLFQSIENREFKFQCSKAVYQVNRIVSTFIFKTQVSL